MGKGRRRRQRNGDDRGGGSSSGRGGGGPGRGRVNEEPAAAATIGDMASRLGSGSNTNIDKMPPYLKFLMACTDGDIARLKEVVECMNKHDRELLASARPLFEAVGSGKIDVCIYLVEELGFDVNAEDNPDSGMTPLLFAVSYGQEIAVRYFLGKGADPNKKNAAGFSHWLQYFAL